MFSSYKNYTSTTELPKGTEITHVVAVTPNTGSTITSSYAVGKADIKNSPPMAHKEQHPSERKMHAPKHMNQPESKWNDTYLQWIAKQDCGAIIQPRRFLSRAEQEAYTPALLYSFPGSGNTWARLLIDQATGVFTGSVYDDITLSQILPGEAHCDRSVSAIKAHPNIQTYQFFSEKSLPAKCKDNGIADYNKTILLVRDPFDAFWSEFQRRYSGGSHTKRIPMQGKRVPGPVLDKWQRVRRYLSEAYVAMCTVDYPAFQRAGPSLLVRYEDLKHSPQRRLSVLANIVEFLGIPGRNAARLEFERTVSSKTSHPIRLPAASIASALTTASGSISEEELLRYHCAFEASENPAAHRHSAPASSAGLHQAQAQPQIQIRGGYRRYVGKADVYSKEVVCSMWETISDCAQKFGYSLLPGVACD